MFPNTTPTRHNTDDRSREKICETRVTGTNVAEALIALEDGWLLYALHIGQAMATLHIIRRKGRRQLLIVSLDTATEPNHAYLQPYAEQEITGRHPMHHISAHQWKER